MAGIDKIYCSSKNDYYEFFEWCLKFDEFFFKEFKYHLIDIFYITPSNVEDCNFNGVNDIPIANTGYYVDFWLICHCPIEWIRYYMFNVFGYHSVSKKYIELYIDRSFNREEYINKYNLDTIKSEIEYMLTNEHNDDDYNKLEKIYNNVISGKHPLCFYKKELDKDISYLNLIL